MPEEIQGPSDEDGDARSRSKGGIEALTIIQAKKGLATTGGVSGSTAALMARVAQASSELADSFTRGGK